MYRKRECREPRKGVSNFVRLPAGYHHERRKEIEKRRDILRRFQVWIIQLPSLNQKAGAVRPEALPFEFPRPCP